MEQEQPSSGLSGLQITGIVIAAMLATMVATLFIIKTWLFPSPFKPVVLSPVEEKRLEVKMARFEQIGSHSTPTVSGRTKSSAPESELEPEAYSEEGASREIKLSEREINAMIAKNTDLASKVAIDFSNDLISLKMLIPTDPDSHR
jgi:hypothetical protein